MTDIEIVDDSGNEFSVTDVPIPFYIRCKLEGENVKYRVKLLDEKGNTRGYYTGTSSRDYLELHVPVIPLRKEGKLLIEIELYDSKLKELTTRKTMINYVDQKSFQEMKAAEKPPLDKKETEEEVIEPEPLAEEKIQEPIKVLPFIRKHKKIKPETSFELTQNEIDYLTLRTVILKETVEPNVPTKIKEISELKSKEEE